MAIEIERKFLVKGDGWRAGVTEARRIRQAYLSQGGPACLRIRLINECEAKLTVKAAASVEGMALSRAEFEYSIPVEDALAMLDLRVGRIVEKMRYLVPQGDGRTWEVDVFAGVYEGLIIAEIELSSPDEAVSLPDWIDREVTGDPGYGNMALALR